jgi:molecular chaperone DnaK
VTITGGTALDQNEIDQMVKDAESYAAADADRREGAEARNGADHAVHTVGKQLAEHGETLTEDEKSPIQTKLDDLKKIIEDEGASTEALTTATGELMESAQVIGQKMYEAAAAEAAAAEAAGGEDGDSAGDDVEEAEVVEAEVVEDDVAEDKVVEDEVVEDKVAEDKVAEDGEEGQ